MAQAPLDTNKVHSQEPHGQRTAFPIAGQHAGSTLAGVYTALDAEQWGPKGWSSQVLPWLVRFDNKVTVQVLRSVLCQVEQMHRC